MNETEQKLKFCNYAANGDMRNVVRLLKKGMSPTQAAVANAASQGHKDIVQLLLRAGKFDENDLNICLIYAVEGGQVKIAQLLLDSGASSNAGTGHGLYRPVLLVASENGVVELVELLLQHGANPDAHDLPVCGDLLGLEINQTALIAATKKGRTEIVRLLLEAGADPAIKGSEGKTAYELIAKRKGRQDIAKLLQDWQKKRPTGRKKNQQAKSALELKATNHAVNWNDVLKRLKELSGVKSTAHPVEKKIRVFPLAANRVRRLTQAKDAEVLSAKDYDRVLLLAQKECASAGASVFLSFDSGVAQICAAPWSDKFKTLIALKTSSANNGMKNKQLVAFLRKIDARCPFNLEECGVSTVGGKFISPIKDCKNLAALLFDVCPFILEDHSGSLGKFEQYLKKEQRFRLWWN